MNINQVAQKIPRPLLVLGILVLSVVIFVINDPLRDECGIQISIFEKKTKGLLSKTRTKTKKTQYPLIEYWKDRCREGNSIGSCSDYFDGLKQMTDELRQVNDKCQIKYSEENENFVKQVTSAVQIMALVAWGEKPPSSPSERMGWLNEPGIKTFCYLKKTLLLIGGEEALKSVRNRVYKEYPGHLPENFDISKLEISSDKNNAQSSDIAKVYAEKRPRAYDNILKPTTGMTLEQRINAVEREIYERSVFSIRCDLYL